MLKSETICSFNTYGFCKTFYAKRNLARPIRKPIAAQPPEKSRLNSSKQQPLKQKASVLKAQRPAPLWPFNLAVICLAITGSNLSPAFSETLQGKVTTVEAAAPIKENAVDLNDFIGVWKVEIPKIRRKPTVTITSVSEQQVQGIYKGLLGTFPLWGNYQAETGEVRLFVDFSRSKLARLTRRSEKAIAHMTGTVNLAERTISGSASLPEFSRRVFAFNGKKADSEARTN